MLFLYEKKTDKLLFGVDYLADVFSKNEPSESVHHVDGTQLAGFVPIIKFYFSNGNLDF